jgi:hypothetical protein
MVTDHSDGILSIPPVTFLDSTQARLQGGSTRFHHFGPWPFSQDADIQFPQKSISTLRCTPYLSKELGTGIKLLFLPSHGPSARRLSVTYRLFDAFGPCTCNNSMVSINCVMTKGSFVTAVQKIIKQWHHFIGPHHISALDFFH